MADIDYTGALAGLRPLEVADLQLYKEAVAASGQVGFAYYFPGLLAKQRPGRTQILTATDNGSLCLYRWNNKDGKPRLDVLFAPLPFDPLVLQRCIERANDFNGDRRARILKIDEKDSGLIAEASQLNVRQRRPQYLYDPDSFGDLAGRKFRTVRRNVNRVEERDDITVRPYSNDCYEGCFDLLKRWRKHHRETHGTLGGFGTSKRLLDIAGKLPERDLCGEVISIDDEIIAFGFGGEIRPGIGAFLEAKSDPAITGLSYFQRYSFLRKQTHFDVINDGSDTGRAGLRQLKQSLRPASMHLEFSGAQR